MKTKKAQSIIEFSFAMMVMMVMLYALIQSSRWVMMDLAERRYDHDGTLLRKGDASAQLTPNFHKARTLDAVLSH